MATAEVELEVGNRTVRISNPGQVYFPARGETKLGSVPGFVVFDLPGAAVAAGGTRLAPDVTVAEVALLARAWRVRLPAAAGLLRFPRWPAASRTQPGSS
jgi:hypothetical protein